jgi:hypothetical protein
VQGIGNVSKLRRVLIASPDSGTRFVSAEMVYDISKSDKLAANRKRGMRGLYWCQSWQSESFMAPLRGPFFASFVKCSTGVRWRLIRTSCSGKDGRLRRTFAQVPLLSRRDRFLTESGTDTVKADDTKCAVGALNILHAGKLRRIQVDLHNGVTLHGDKKTSQRRIRRLPPYPPLLQLVYLALPAHLRAETDATP